MRRICVVPIANEGFNNLGVAYEKRDFSRVQALENYPSITGDVKLKSLMGGVFVCFITNFSNLDHPLRNYEIRTTSALPHRSMSHWDTCLINQGVLVIVALLTLTRYTK